MKSRVIALPAPGGPLSPRPRMRTCPTQTSPPEASLARWRCRSRTETRATMGEPVEGSWPLDGEGGTRSWERVPAWESCSSRRSPDQVPYKLVACPVSEGEAGVVDAARGASPGSTCAGRPNPVPVPRPAACDPQLRLFADPEPHQAATRSAVRPQVEQARRSVVDLEPEEQTLGLLIVAIDHHWSRDVIRGQQSRLYAELDQTGLLRAGGEDRP